MVQTAAMQAAQAKPQAVPRAKPKPRRKVARTTQLYDFDSLFGFPSGKPQ